jgi:hypothetical protein
MTLELFLALLVQQTTGSTSEPLVPGPVIELPGVKGRIDHLAIDLARKRLYVAALGNDSVEVVDLEAGKRAQSLRGPKEPQGILYLPDLDRMVVSSGKGGTCDVYDGNTLELVASVDVGDDADNLRYDARRKRLYVAYGDGGIAVIDAQTWKVLERIPLDGHPEAFQLGLGDGRAFVNVPGAHQVAVIDLAKHGVLATWKVDEAGANFPMTLVPGDGTKDPAGLLLLGCRSPAKLVVRSLKDGTPVQVLDLSGDTDDLFYDVERRRVYAACGEGFVDVLAHEQGKLRPLTRVATASGARTCLFVPDRDEIFVAVPHRGSQRAEVRILKVRDG